MYLKTLTLRGFKSFASATTLRFEPGITTVVGPNGSGKSNVVDALAWVMGEQGAKSLRGGKMEDVIFAGTSSRAPLGRAEVSLTIDNSDGALPIDYTEVTIKRTMFRNGGSEYAINGDTCRLLDIQDLLSDSGIGREMHVIVGQGQLDTVLHAGPEERRALVEEAAGILKHRKRKEKALRKLDAMQGNLDRVTDLTAELRRQLKPLGRQAELARRAAVIQADLRDARLRLLADDIVTLREALEKEEADEAAVRTRREAAERSLADAQAREATLEAAATEAAPLLAAAQDAYHGLSRLKERLSAVAGLAAERHRHLAADPGEERFGRDPDDLEREAEEARAQEEELQYRLDDSREVLERSVAERAAAEEALKEEERRVAAAARAAADRREGLAKLRGRVDALRSRLAASEAEVERLDAAAVEARERAEAAQAEYEFAEADAAGLDEGDAELDAAYERAKERLAAVEARLNELRDAERTAERERAALAARKEALEMGLARKDGAGALMAAGDRLPGLLGSVAALVEVEPGHETAVAAALGAASDAVAVESLADALAALDLLKGDDAGRAGIVVGAGAAATVPRAEWPRPPAGLRYALDAVTAPAPLHGALTALLERVVLVADAPAARDLLDSHPDLRAVTAEGDVFGPGLVQGGSSSAPSLLEVQAAVDEAAQLLARATETARRAAADLAEAKEERADLATELDEVTARRRAADKRRNDAAQHLGKLGGQARAAAAEVERYTAAAAKAAAGRQSDLDALADLETRLAEAEAEPLDDGEPDTERRDALADAASAARAAETEARLSVRTAEERVRSIAGRADSLLRAAEAERQARRRAAERRARRRRQSRVAEAVADAAAQALERIAVSLAHADTERRTAEEERAARDAELKTVRARVRELSVELEKLVNVVHGSEVARAERRLRLEQLETRAVEEMGVDVDTLIAEYGPRVPVPPPADAPEDEAVPVPYVREVQEKRARAAERQLNQLGKINPLALEEFAALEERHAFLNAQLEDLKKTRRDLLSVVEQVDARVQEVFSAAYTDVEREFTQIFGRLFPGGEGRLVLTDPDNMLTTGIEVEARPPGKKVKRLSLLSGGERSLTAVAFLAAIFKARPSPFYVMDEVEAALDDTNLQRLLVIFEELRASSQLIVITHQKRTMEAADALYGVTMQNDGISQVISQKLDRDRPGP
ncbi:chromosome segregation protein SMC [Streptomonospora nanhaiensis]|uniref:Chromosome partition protein Smc n=1 Tax=Streptomonospora nanhaiensis TaxID=1323731 RepID=A0A853BSF1_9ACTN|nr:chromosome segregation protein SMC [Streptomonospora nanhaiensis]MBV2362580.1 chromosome segregation protein SMC [Streptomonospora nanhaiensis]MBX9386859.1 chromosome segregation protein SMC [Streptomonospora nanhaiensis]NYI98073.1 chromosome segregation protein [Streptomonospora nanhaiensis]